MHSSYNVSMPFNHYAKIKHILDQQPSDWYILRINKPTSARTFKNEIRHFPHYYRIMTSDGQPIKYCKFQQLDRLAQILQTDIENLPVVDIESE